MSSSSKRRCLLGNGSPAPSSCNCPFQYCESRDVTSSVKHCWRELLALTNHFVESYTIHKNIGQGTFGTIFLAKTKVSLLENIDNDRLQPVMKGEYVAIKVFTAVVHPKATEADEILVEHECCILRKVASSSYMSIRSKFIVDLIETVNYAVVKRPFAAVFRFFEHSSYEDYCMQMTETHLKMYMFGMLSALAYVHDMNVIHRDIKPGNCLFNFVSMEFKLCDFGLSVSDLDAGYAMKPSDTRYNRCDRVKLEVRVRAGVRSRPVLFKPPHEFNRSGTTGFRAPEVLFECGRQSKAIDMWSAGAVFCALLNKHPGYAWFGSWALQRTTRRMGTFTHEKKSQARPWNTKCIAELIGVFGRENVIRAAEAVGHVDPKSFGGPQYELPAGVNIFIPIEEALCHDGGVGKSFVNVPEAFDIAFGCLQLIPKERLTVAEALRSSFFSN